MPEVNATLRRDIFNQLQMVVTGRPAIESTAAAYDLMGALTAFICDSPDEADRVLRQTVEDLIRDVRENWAESREQRARSFVAFNTHEGPRA